MSFFCCTFAPQRFSNLFLFNLKICYYEENLIFLCCLNGNDSNGFRYGDCGAGDGA